MQLELDLSIVGYVAHCFEIRFGEHGYKLTHQSAIVFRSCKISSSGKREWKTLIKKTGNLSNRRTRSKMGTPCIVDRYFHDLLILSIPVDEFPHTLLDRNLRYVVQQTLGLA